VNLLLESLLYGLWTLISATSLFVIWIALPGGWITLALAVGYDAMFGFERIGWTALLVFAGLMTLAEIIESILGTIYVAKKGATRWGMVGAFSGGLVGAFVGSSALPVIGTVLGGFAGAFAGAVGMEYWRDSQLQPSLRIGLHATIGRFLAMAVKFALALSGFLWCAIRAWPSN